MFKKVLIFLTIGTILIGTIIGLLIYNNRSIEPQKELETKDESIENIISGIDFKNIYLTDNMSKVTLDIIVSSDDVKSMIDYYLQQKNNIKIDETNIEIKENSILLTANYKITDDIITPIEIELIPSITNNNDLQLEIVNVKLLELKIPDKLLNIIFDKFIADLFTDAEINSTNIIINKDKFEGIILNNIVINLDEMTINVTMDVNKVFK